MNCPYSMYKERRMKKILFVCYGNICRSPMAEFVMKDIVSRAGMGDCFEIASAATSSEETGSPVYYLTREKLEQHGIDCSAKRARQMRKSDYRDFDLLIGMESSNLTAMRRICGGDPDGKIMRLLDFTDHPADIADPWYTRDFNSTWKDVNRGCRALLESLI